MLVTPSVVNGIIMAEKNSGNYEEGEVWILAQFNFRLVKLPTLLLRASVFTCLTWEMGRKEGHMGALMTSRVSSSSQILSAHCNLQFPEGK